MTIKSDEPLPYTSAKPKAKESRRRSAAIYGITPGMEIWRMPATEQSTSQDAPATVTGAVPTFEEQAARAVGVVRKSILAMLESDGRQLLKSRDAQKYFAVDANLSWQLFKLSSSTDLLGAAQYVPPAVSMEKLVKAARERGVEEPLVSAAERAFDEFSAFVTLHAGDRSRFESMAAASSDDEEAKQMDLQHRKNLFKSHSYFWGLEVGTMYWATMIGPDREDASTYDMVHLRTLLEFNRLRTNADTHVSGIQYKPREGRNQRLRPVDMEAFEKYGASVLPKFSNKALPHLQTKELESGERTTYLAGGAVGLTGTMDMTFADVVKNVPIETWARDGSAGTSMYTTRPTRQLVMEFVWHRSLPVMVPEVELYGHVPHPGGPRPEKADVAQWRLPCRDAAVRLAPQDDARMAAIPRRREMLTHVCDALGWNLDEFDVYRLAVEYPILDTMMILLLKMPTT